MKVSAVKVIADAMLEKKAQNVVSLDLRSIGTAITDAVGQYVTDVKQKDFPNENESY